MPVPVSALVDAVVIIAALVVLTRLAGLRSFSKMSGFDFAITVAMGSVLASVVVSPDTGILAGLSALTALFLVQAVVARARVASSRTQEVLDNAPLLIMDGPTMLEGNMQAAKISRADLLGKLREANVTQLSQVQAVVFEATGDVSVLHRGDGEIDAVLLEDVVREA
ncbi:DUF421 domain-containing protein [Aestuariibius sp. 2305UL40-4]|uniref:DUF421 domain-containing protein n=1 Tax=Aestuariibius violaceus TaxID=3234132 RepID=UPI00345ED7F7